MKITTLLKFLLGSWLTFRVVEGEGGGEGEGKDGANAGGEGENGEVVGTQNNDRLAMYEQIADNAEADRAEQARGEGVDIDRSDEPIEEEPVVVKQETPAPAPKIKVNGQEVEITPELIEKAQKIAAADQYLADAARTRREAEVAQNTQKPSDKDASANVDDDDVALARALQMGTEEEAVKAIQAIKSKTPSLNKDEIVAAARDAMAQDEAIKWFQSEYKFIWADPYLTKLAIGRDNELLQAENLNYRDRYERIGKELTEWTGKLPRAAESKQERKAAAADNVVQMAARRAEPPQQGETDESASEIIAKIAKSRGQAT